MSEGPSERRRLIRRIRDLARTFLPPADATGSYSTEQYDRVSAFLLLTHAELEAFIESRCTHVANTAVKAWELDSVPRKAILGLIAFAHSGGQSAIPDESSGLSPTIREIVKDAKVAYSKTVSKNHGIKEKNLLQLLLPIGVRETDFPSGLLQEMDALGTLRGSHAHRNLGAKTPPDPLDSLNRVARVVFGLRKLDQIMLTMCDVPTIDSSDRPSPKQTLP